MYHISCLNQLVYFRIYYKQYIAETYDEQGPVVGVSVPALVRLLSSENVGHAC